MTASERVIVPEPGGRRLDVLLADLLGEPRSRSAARVARGEIRVDGVVARHKSQRVDVGAVVDVGALPVAVASAPPPVPPVRFEDDHLLVVSKPPDLVVHPGVGHPDATLVDALGAAGIALAPAGGADRPGVVHRLDRDTSGLLVVAKTDAAWHGLVAALQRREVERRYLTLVEGVPAATSGRVDAPIGRHPRDRVRFAVLADGKPAVTHWVQVATGTAGESSEVTLVACRLETGRTHQIRVHLAYAHLPVVGDLAYGATSATAAALELRRPFLHAARLAFTHPVTGTPVAVDEPLPADLRAALALAGIDADRVERAHEGPPIP